jgi:perosamine synthetase
LDLGNRKGLPIIEDAAEALCSRSCGKPLGTLGIMGCFSLSPNKTITTGQGGYIATNDSGIHIRLRELKDQGRPVKGTGGDDLHHSIGFNFKFTNLQAAVGLGQLHSLEGRLERQKAIYRGYAQGLQGAPGLRLPGFHLDHGEIPQWTDAVHERRDALDQFLRERNMHCRRFWHPIHTQKPYYQTDDRFPISTKVCRQALWLPSAYTLTDDDVTSVCASVQEFCRAR